MNKKPLLMVGGVLLACLVALTSCGKSIHERGAEFPEVTIPVVLQQGNNLPKFQLQPKESRELEDNRIGGYWHGLSALGGRQQVLKEEIAGVGLKRVRLAINSCDASSVDWELPEFSFDQSYDDWITDIAESGVTITYVLSFWDKTKWPREVSQPRFKTEEDIVSYLEFVKYIVNRFKDRVQYFELWNEPNVGEGCGPGATLECLQHIELEDYVNLVKRTVPVIRQESPTAKVIVGAIPELWTLAGYEYFFGILNSDIMPLVDAVSWHPMYATTPADERWRGYYYNYPSLIREIKDVAHSHGFSGEFIADELTWWNPENAPKDQPWVPILPYSESICAKYYARAIVIHLGLDVTVGLGGTSRARQASTSTIRNLCTVMAGAKPISLPLETQSEATNIESYAFSLPNGDKLLALWTDGVAVDNEPGVDATLTFPDFSVQKVIGIDVLNGFEQELIADIEQGSLVVCNLLIGDYPIILRLTP